MPNPAKLRNAFAALAGLLLLVSGSSPAFDPYDPSKGYCGPSGKSIPAWLEPFFNHACYKHDECYNQCANIWPSNELHFFENDSADLGHYVIVKLKGDGVTTNAMGIGARVTVDAGGVKLLKELGGGYGHQTMQHDTVLFFGVGACAVLAGITVVWPNAARTTEVWHDVPAGRMIELRQGDSAVYDVTPQ